MKTKTLLGIVLLLYATIVFFVTLKKPKQIWSIGKIKGFEKMLGEKGTEIFFMPLEFWLMTK